MKQKHVAAVLDGWMGVLGDRDRLAQWYGRDLAPGEDLAVASALLRAYEEASRAWTQDLKSARKRR